MSKIIGMMQVAETITNILRSEGAVTLSWGVKSFIYTEYEGMTGLMFRVNGLLHKGEVFVGYNERADLFDVLTIKDGRTIVHFAGVYADCLVDTIDMLVEKNTSIDEYRKLVDRHYNK